MSANTPWTPRQGSRRARSRRFSANVHCRFGHSLGAEKRSSGRASIAVARVAALRPCRAAAPICRMRRCARLAACAARRPFSRGRRALPSREGTGARSGASCIANWQPVQSSKDAKRGGPSEPARSSVPGPHALASVEAFRGRGIVRACATTLGAGVLRGFALERFATGAKRRFPPKPRGRRSPAARWGVRSTPRRTPLA